MGYYTLHKISIINKYNKLRNLETLLEVIEEVTDYAFRIQECGEESYIIDDNWNCGYGSKWYSFDEDIYIISEKLPKFKIFVEAKGEDGETWEKIVKDGYDAFYNDNSSENEEEDNSNDDEENDDEENEEENYNDNNDNNDIGIEEIFQDMKINDNQIFRR